MYRLYYALAASLFGFILINLVTSVAFYLVLTQLHIQIPASKLRNQYNIYTVVPYSYEKIQVEPIGLRSLINEQLDSGVTRTMITSELSQGLTSDIRHDRSVSTHPLLISLIQEAGYWMARAAAFAHWLLAWLNPFGSGITFLVTAFGFFVFGWFHSNSNEAIFRPLRQDQETGAIRGVLNLFLQRTSTERPMLSALIIALNLQVFCWILHFTDAYILTYIYAKLFVFLGNAVISETFSFIAYLLLNFIGILYAFMLGFVEYAHHAARNPWLFLNLWFGIVLAYLSRRMGILEHNPQVEE